MQISKVIVGAIVAALAIPAASAAWASSEDEAARLTKVLSHVVGDRPGIVTVKTDGDGYLATVNLVPLVAELSSGAFTVTVTPLNYHLSPDGSGHWRVTGDQPLAVSAAASVPAAGGAGFSYSLVIEHLRSTSVFDEASERFLSSESTGAGISSDQVVPVKDGGTSHVTQTIAEVSTELAVAPDSGGRLATSFKAKLSGVTQMMQGVAYAAPLGDQIKVTIDRITHEGQIHGQPDFSFVKLILALAPYRASEATHPPIAGLKPIVQSMMPLFERMEWNSKAEHIVVETGIGRFGLASLGADLSLNGIVQNGFLRERITLSGPEFPAGLVPDWGKPLFPKDLVVDVSVSGFDLATPANILIDRMGSPEQSLPPEIQQALLKSLLPSGAVTIGLGPSRLTTNSASVDAEGTFGVGPGSPPTVKAAVKAHGLDQAIAALTSAPPNTVPDTVLPMLFFVKGLAKAEGDNLVWNISLAPGGPILVNGAPFQTQPQPKAPPK